MRRVHPLWRGFWLAAALTAVLTLLHGPDELAPYRLDKQALVMASAMAGGVFLTWLPALLRRRRLPLRPGWQRCARAFLCGCAMALGCGLVGSGRLLPALVQGSIGGYAFLPAAWLGGLTAVRLAGRRARP